MNKNRMGGVPALSGCPAGGQLCAPPGGSARGRGQVAAAVAGARLLTFRKCRSVKSGGAKGSIFRIFPAKARRGRKCRQNGCAAITPWHSAACWPGGPGCAMDWPRFLRKIRNHPAFVLSLTPSPCAQLTPQRTNVLTKVTVSRTGINRSIPEDEWKNIQAPFMRPDWSTVQGLRRGEWLKIGGCPFPSDYSSWFSCF